MILRIKAIKQDIEIVHIIYWYSTKKFNIHNCIGIQLHNQLRKTVLCIQPKPFLYECISFLSNLGYVKTMPRCTLQVIKMQGMSIRMCNMYVQNKQKLQHFFMSACLYIDNQRNAGLKKLIYFFYWSTYQTKHWPENFIKALKSKLRELSWYSMYQIMKKYLVLHISTKRQIIFFKID